MDESVLARYDTVILDPGYKGSVGKIAHSGATVYSYLSLGEVRSTDPIFIDVEPGVLRGESTDWPGTYRVDIRQSSWRALILTRAIPRIRALGYNGLLLDTLDTPPYLEQVDPNSNRGMRRAAIQLVVAIRDLYPDMRLIMNRGYALLADVIGSIDGLVAESLMTRFDSTAPSGFRWNDPAEVSLQLSLISNAMRGAAALPVFSLDYWSSEDAVMVRRIYCCERALGHHPYVGPRALDSIMIEPDL